MDAFFSRLYSHSGHPAPTSRCPSARWTGAHRWLGRGDRRRSVHGIRERGQDVYRAGCARQLPQRPGRTCHEQHGLANAIPRLGGHGPSQGRIGGRQTDLRWSCRAGRDRPLVSDTGYTTFDEHTGGVTRIDHPGGVPAAPSVKAVNWTAQAQGVGTQTLSWKATDGPQVVFAMNADVSRPVAVRIVSSAVTLGRCRGGSLRARWSSESSCCGAESSFCGERREVVVLRRATRVVEPRPTRWRMEPDRINPEGVVHMEKQMRTQTRTPTSTPNWKCPFRCSLQRT